MYNLRAGGGEGHLEVAKNIYYSNKDMCHMVLSLKPFGCMPSTQSDGVQSAVVNQYKDMIYLPVETSGEGEINAHSRVQMALGEAKVKAREEMERVLERTGRTLDEVRYAEEHPEPQDPPTRCPTPRASSGRRDLRRARGRADDEGRRATAAVRPVGPEHGRARPRAALHRPGRRLDDGQGGRRRPRRRRGPLGGLPAPRHQAAREVPSSSSPGSRPTS